MSSKHGLVAGAEERLKNAEALVRRQWEVITRLSALGADETRARQQLAEAEE